MIVPPVVPSRPSRARLHVTREHGQRDERWDEHREVTTPLTEPAMSDEDRETIRQPGAEDARRPDPARTNRTDRRPGSGRGARRDPARHSRPRPPSESISDERNPAA